MNDLITQLTAAGQQHKGTDLGGLLQWAVLHINDQAEALTATQAELEDEQNERLRLERALHNGAQAITTVLDGLKAAQPVQITLARDHAPHINIMAHHGVAPYARRMRGKKVEACTTGQK